MVQSFMNPYSGAYKTFFVHIYINKDSFWTGLSFLCLYRSVLESISYNSLTHPHIMREFEIVPIRDNMARFYLVCCKNNMYSGKPHFLTNSV